jgi:hypothetical protein
VENTIFYSSSQSTENAHRANDLTYNGTPYIENEEWNGKKYYHGEFNFHTYSPVRGESPGYDSYYDEVPYQNADLNNDNSISIYETREWELLYSDNQNETSQFIDESGLASTTSLKYPTIIPQDVSNDLILSGIIGISHPIHILDGCTLTITDNSIVYLDYAGELIVDQGGSLVLGDSVTFTAFDIAGTVKRIVINGGFEVGIKPVFELFKNNPSENVLHIFINNPNLEVLFKSGSFNEVLLEAYNIHNIFDSCSFRPGNVIGNNGDYNFLNCWIAGEVHLFNKKNERFVDVDSCKFYGFYNGTALRIENYSHVRISSTLFDKSCSFFPGYEVAIFLANSGTRIGMINNCEILQSSNTGIISYNSNVRIVGNKVANNGIGLKFLNRSNIGLHGSSTEMTQFIQFNQTGEIYSTWESFPYFIKYNLFKKLYQSEYFISCSPAPIDKDYDVRENSWSPPDPEPYLFPTGKFIWIPVWQPNPGLKSSDIAESMYFSALGLIESEDFNQAKAVLMQLVNDYPYSSFSQAALRDLFEIEDFCGSNFFALRNYYQSDSVIQNNASLLKRAGFFANQCEIKLKNWPSAIYWFEDVIQNPESYEDSLFAIIDLGYTYLLMADSGYKSIYTGRLPEYKPVSREQFSKNRDYLLSLIPNDRSNSIIQENLSLLKYGELLQNVPNPFSGSTQIWFKIEEKSFVMIHVFDYTGKRIKTFNRGMLEKGTHSANFSANDAGLATGLYFYSLEVNGQFTDSKKMTILK